MTFDSSEFYSTMSDVETYLGYLKGNELAFDYLHQALISVTGGPGPGEVIMPVWLDEDYKFPCPDGKYAAKPFRGFFCFNVPYPAGSNADNLPSPTPYEWVQQVQQGADEAFHNGASWANGIGWYASGIVDRIVKPDAVKLDAAGRSLKADVVSELSNSASVDWAGIEGLLSEWHGEAKTAFDQFYRSASSLLVAYTSFTAYAYAGTMVATKIISGTQNGLMKYATSLRDAVTDQLNAWCDFGMPPKDTPKTPKWAAKVEQIAGDSYELLGHVPVVQEVTGKIDDVVGIIQGVEKIAVDLGWDPPHDEGPFDAMTAEELYEDMSKTLREGYYDKWVAAMEASKTGAPTSDLGDDDPYSANNVLHLLHEREKQYGWGLDQVGNGSLITPPDPSDDKNHDGVDDGSIYRA